MFDAETLDWMRVAPSCIVPVWYVNWEGDIAGHQCHDASSLTREEKVTGYLERYFDAAHQRSGLDRGRANVIVDFGTGV